MKHRSLSLIVLLLVISSLVLSACANVTPPPATNPPAQPPTTAPQKPPEPTAVPAKPTEAPAPPAPTEAPTGAPTQQVLRLATTTSTADSGLLDFILPDFQTKFNTRVDVVAVGTGQAIAIGQKGDADVLLVHARKSEDQFVADGDAKERFDVMYNDFIVLGPKEDPAKASSAASAKDAFKAIMDTQSTFASRGDKSGTNTKELSIWSSLGVTPTKDMPWYKALGQGMGDTLTFANEQKAYTLSDRGTYLSMRDKLPDLIIVLGGNTLAENKDSSLLNPYGIMAVNPDKHPGVNYDLAMQFVNWFLSKDTQQVIGSYGKDKFGQSLFYPNSEEYKATYEVSVKVGDKSQSFALADLQALPKTTIADYEATGVKKGPLGKNTWAGASLKDLLLKVDPALADAKNADKQIVLTSSDGWKATIKWSELFGTPKGGEVLYDVKGCNECHGVNGEGTAPKGKTPTPMLVGATWLADTVLKTLRTGKDAHGGVNPYTEQQLSEAELAQLLAWFKAPKAAPADAAYTIDPAKQVAILAYEKNGKAMNGHDGILQLIVAFDQFAGRYSHWVQSIEAK
jgi:tungstate transport system substrate-binding protein